MKPTTLASIGHYPVLIATIAGAATSALGLVTLVGWHTGTDSLMQVLPTLVPIQYNAAWSLLLSGVGLIGLAQRRTRLTVGLGSVVGLLAVGTLVEYAFGTHLGFDEVRFDAYLPVGPSRSIRMAHNTALGFGLTAAALITSALSTQPNRRFWLTSGFGLGILSFCSISFWGYLMGVQTVLGGGATHAHDSAYLPGTHDACVGHPRHRFS